mmetsp:Transcript_8822/g.20741  ORF Transcript_8822/g.20741 Transcript_8822/m.20741 type:complete len:235 (+) Transcript_8822:96-800(+)
MGTRWRFLTRSLNCACASFQASTKVSLACSLRPGILPTSIAGSPFSTLGHQTTMLMLPGSGAFFTVSRTARPPFKFLISQSVSSSGVTLNSHSPCQSTLPRTMRRTSMSDTSMDTSLALMSSGTKTLISTDSLVWDQQYLSPTDPPVLYLDPGGETEAGVGSSRERALLAVSSLTLLPSLSATCPLAACSKASRPGHWAPPSRSAFSNSLTASTASPRLSALSANARHWRTSSR